MLIADNNNDSDSTVQQTSSSTMTGRFDNCLSEQYQVNEREGEGECQVGVDLICDSVMMVMVVSLKLTVKAHR